MVYTIIQRRGSKTYIFDTVYADMAIQYADNSSVYAGGVKVDFTGILNFIGSIWYEYRGPMTEEEAQYNIDCWLADGVDLPSGMTAGILSEFFNKFYGGTEE